MCLHPRSNGMKTFYNWIDVRNALVAKRKFLFTEFQSLSKIMNCDDISKLPLLDLIGSFILNISISVFVTKLTLSK